MKLMFALLFPITLHAQTPVGAHGSIGALAGAKVVSRLKITKPGVYENLIIDGNFAPGNLVKITADEVTLRNCYISYPSGDCIQFDPDRQSSGKVVVENCTLWTGPLMVDLAGFKAGQRPGENALDTKVKLDGPRCQLVMRK